MRATDGVYYRREDYAAFWRRLLIDVIDFLVVGAACSILALAVWTMFQSGATLDSLLAVCAVFVFCYFVPLKRSKFRTMGYRVGGVKIVGLDGQPASYSALTLRLLFAALGPLNWLLDLAWLSDDKHHQALRDKFAQTYVVKILAEPAGRGRFLFQYCSICGYNFLFREVGTDKSINSH
jgi:uncharacterized RDD family membrane protein YckC